MLKTPPHCSTVHKSYMTAKSKEPFWKGTRRTTTPLRSLFGRLRSVSDKDKVVVRGVRDGRRFSRPSSSKNSFPGSSPPAPRTPGVFTETDRYRRQTLDVVRNGESVKIIYTPPLHDGWFLGARGPPERFYLLK